MEVYNEKQISDTLKIIDSSIVNCEKIQPKLKVGSPQLSLSKNRIKALYISKALITDLDHGYTKEELEKALIQITSIKNKSTTGINNAKKGTGTYTRFNNLINAMNVIIDYINNELTKMD